VRGPSINENVMRARRRQRTKRSPARLAVAPLFFVRSNVSRRRNARGMVVAEMSAAVMTTSR